MGSETYYAVMNGKKPGVYKTWSECEVQVKGFRNAQYKKFPTFREAEAFVNLGRPTTNFNTPKPEPKFQATRISIFKQFNRESPTTTTSPAAATAATRLSTPASGLKREREEHNADSSSSSGSNSSSSNNSNSNSYSRPTKMRKPASSNKETYAVVYTDGASSNNGKVHARAGYGVYWGDDDPRNVSARLKGERQTNQRAEAMAVLHVLDETKYSSEPLEIRTDSQYVINGATIWCKNWIKKNWIATNGREVQNRDLFEPIVNLIAMRKGHVKFTYVPGHSGFEGNEKADELAVKGAQMDDAI